MNEEDIHLIDKISKIRNITPGTKKNYIKAVNLYTTYHHKTLTSMIDEAETEEEQGIRLKNRTLKTRLITFRNYLVDEKQYAKDTVKQTVSIIKTIYTTFEIEIPSLPHFNQKVVKEYPTIYYDDLPTRELIHEAVQLSDPLISAVILFITSSGCAKAETLSLTIQDFIDATSDYHNATDITEVMNALHESGDVVPTFKLRRRKTNKHYYTFCSPEAVDAILAYLQTRKDTLTNESKLFRINENYFNKKFLALNNLLGGKKKGAYGLIRSHMLRKFHASNLKLGKNGLSLAEIDSLQGRSKSDVHNSYFFDSPTELKKKYISNIDKVLITTEVNEITFKSEEYLELQRENEKLKLENDKIKREIEDAVDDRINEVFKKFNIDDILSRNGL